MRCPSMTRRFPIAASRASEKGIKATWLEQNKAAPCGNERAQPTSRHSEPSWPPKVLRQSGQGAKPWWAPIRRVASRTSSSRALQNCSGSSAMPPHRPCVSRFSSNQSRIVSGPQSALADADYLLDGLKGRAEPRVLARVKLVRAMALSWNRRYTQAVESMQQLADEYRQSVDPEVAARLRGCPPSRLRVFDPLLE